MSNQPTTLFDKAREVAHSEEAQRDMEAYFMFEGRRYALYLEERSRTIVHVFDDITDQKVDGFALSDSWYTGT